MVSAPIVLALDAISSISSRGLLRASRASSDSEHRAFDHRPWSVCHTERPSIRLYGAHQALANCSISSSSRVLLRASRALSVVFSSPCPSVSAVTAPSRRPGPSRRDRHQVLALAVMAPSRRRPGSRPPRSPPRARPRPSRRRHAAPAPGRRQGGRRGLGRTGLGFRVFL